MLTKASTRSKPYASLSTATLTFSSLVFVLILKESFIRKRFCKPHWDERLNSAKRFFWKKRIHNEWFAHAIAPPDDSTHVTPLPSVSKIESFSLLIMVMVHGSAVMGGARVQFAGVDGIDFCTEQHVYLPRPPSFSILDNLVFIVIGIPIYLR